MTLTTSEILALIAAGGEPYSAVRDQIKSGDLLLLHHDFIPTLYGLQIAAVQEWTGPFAHIAILDRIVMDGEERVAVWESVVDKFRMVPVTSTVEDTAGFIWVPLNRPMTAVERAAAWALTGKGPYSKPGAVRAGLASRGFAQMPADEDVDPRMWCAKATNILRRKSEVELGAHYVPTNMAYEAANRYDAPLRYVRMN